MDLTRDNEIKALIAEADANDDGKVDFNELSAANLKSSWPCGWYAVPLGAVKYPATCNSAIYNWGKCLVTSQPAAVAPVVVKPEVSECETHGTHWDLLWAIIVLSIFLGICCLCLICVRYNSKCYAKFGRKQALTFTA